MKVAIVAMINSFRESYSIVSILKEHLKMLLANGIDVKVLIPETCNRDDQKGILLNPNIEWVEICNKINGENFKWYNYSELNSIVHKSFYKEVNLVAKDFEKHLNDVDICILHDILRQSWYLIHNVAIRKTQKNLLNLKFIAFTHSEPLEPPTKGSLRWPISAMYEPMDNTIFAYPTSAGIEKLAREYKVDIDKCRVVNNSFDYFNYMTEEVRLVHRKLDILSPDILIVYPTRLNVNKKLEKIAMIAGALKRQFSKSVKVIFCDVEEYSVNTAVYKSFVYNTGVEYGLNISDILFTSDIGFTRGVSHETVINLLTLSNLFIMPSISESFGLVVLEAASTGNLLVLNENTPALKETGMNLGAILIDFDDSNVALYAKGINDKLEANEIIKAKTVVRQRYSNEWIWENQLKPILFLQKTIDIYTSIH